MTPSAAKSTGSLPTTCTASVCSGTPWAAAIWASSRPAAGRPVSLLPSMTLARRVSRAEPPGKLIEPHDALAGDADAVDRPAQAFQMGQRARDAGMFDRRGDDFARLRRAGQGQAEDRQVIGFGPAAGEDHPIGLGAGQIGSEHLADRFAGVLELRRARRPAWC